MKPYAAIAVVVLAAQPSFAADPPKKPDATAPAPAPTTPAPGAPGAQAAGPLGQVAQAQKSPERERLDGALRDIREERYGPASVTLADIAESSQIPDIKDEAQYNLGKALYRMKLHHSALTEFEAVLSRGPQGRFYRSSLEWCLFIARKVTGDERVLASISKYAGEAFPDEYKNEFRYLMARYHFVKSQTLEAEGTATTVGETRTEETATGGKSIKGDIFGDDTGEEEPAPKEEAKGGKGGKGSMSIAEDIFGDDEEDKPKKKKPEKKEKAGEKPADKKAVAGAEPPKKGGELTSKEHLEAAGRLVLQVEPSSPFAAKAKFLEGVVAYKQGKDNDAVESFKSVVRLTRPGAQTEDEELRQLAFFQLARSHFGAKQPSFSIYYYDKIERFTYEWLEALYESSWAEFRLGNYEKALGNLLTLHSPFFEREYFPESHILKAVVYYENCRYPEAKQILTRFLKRYEPVHEELKRLTARDLPPAKYYETLANLRTTGVAAGGAGTPDAPGANDADKGAIVSQVLSIALSDRGLEKLDASYREVDAEMKSFDGLGPVFAQSKLRASLDKSLGTVREDLQREAGRAVKRKLDAEREAMKSLIQQAIRIDIETARAEQERIESQLREVETRPKELQKEFVEWTNDERLVWPFKDEYWRDELGTYQLTLAHSCR